MWLWNSLAVCSQWKWWRKHQGEEKMCSFEWLTTQKTEKLLTLLLGFAPAWWNMRPSILARGRGESTLSHIFSLSETKWTKTGVKKCFTCLLPSLLNYSNVSIHIHARTLSELPRTTSVAIGEWSGRKTGDNCRRPPTTTQILKNVCKLLASAPFTFAFWRTYFAPLSRSRHFSSAFCRVFYSFHSVEKIQLNYCIH